ncbi:MAG: IclR family transcriptional regulator [Acidimicrobiia bacterium]
MTETDQGTQTITAVERAANVLLLFAETDRADLGVTEISNELGLSKAVVHRILNSLKANDLVESNEGTHRYSLGPAAVALGLTYLNRIDVRNVARPIIRELSNTMDETATLSILSGSERIYIDQVTPAREVKMEVVLGHPYPLHAGGSSKVMLAHLPLNEIDEYLNNDLSALTDATITDTGELREELSQIREQGFAVSLGERRSDAGSVAAAVFDHEGRPVAAMSLCGPAERFANEVPEASTLIVNASRRVSQLLGYRT